ncbi:hypothetical protein ACFL1X_12370 [Candidatus Hydrogenedentota bacterium]
MKYTIDFAGSKLSGAKQEFFKDAVGILHKLYRDNLLEVAVYGSPGAERGKNTPLTMLILIPSVTADDMEHLRPYLQKWQKKQNVMVELSAPSIILAKAGVFPIRIMDIKQSAFHLFGQEILESTEISREALEREFVRDLQAVLISSIRRYLRDGDSTRECQSIVVGTISKLFHVIGAAVRMEEPDFQKLGASVTSTAAKLFGVDEQSLILLQSKQDSSHKLTLGEMKRMMDLLISIIRKVSEHYSQTSNVRNPTVFTAVEEGDAVPTT